MNNENNLIIGMGPVGLYLAIKLLEEGKLVTIVENRHSFTRKQILGLIPENYEKIKGYCKNKYTFGKIRLPRTDFDGYICEDLNLKDDYEKVNNVYSFTLNVLQTELYNHIENNKKCIILKPKSEFDTLEITFNEKDDKIDFIFKIGPNIDAVRSQTKKFSDYNNIFFCSGGGEKINLVNEIRNMYPHSIPDLTKAKVIIEDIKTSVIPEVGTGYIYYLYPKSIDAVKYLIKMKNKCDYSSFQLYQNKFRFFISPSILEYIIDKDDNVVKKENNTEKLTIDEVKKKNIFIYLGLQISNNEKNINNSPVLLINHILESLKVAYIYYDIDEKLFETESPTFEKDDLDGNGFSIQLSYFTNCIKDYNNTKICLVGDALSKVNFFSYSGFNFGVFNVDAIMDDIKNNRVINNTNIYNFLNKTKDKSGKEIDGKYGKKLFLRSSLTVTIRDFLLSIGGMSSKDNINKIIDNLKKNKKKEYNRIIKILENPDIDNIYKYAFALSVKIPNIKPVYKGIFKFKKINTNEYACAWSPKSNNNYILGKWTGNWRHHTNPKIFDGKFSSFNGNIINGYWTGQWDKDLKGEDEFIGIFNEHAKYNNFLLDTETKKILEDFKKNNYEFIGGSYMNKIDILELYYEQKYLIYKNKYLDLKKIFNK